MFRSITVGVLLAGALAGTSWAQNDDGGHVDLPLDAWLRLVEQRERPVSAAQPGADVAYLDQQLEGAYHKGLLRAKLVTRFQVFRTDGHLRVPVLDQAASAERVRLDGGPTSLVAAGDMYTVGVDAPGVYTVETTFYLGEEDDEFTRRIQMKLPGGGVTRLSVLVPEPDIEPHLANGVVTASTARGSGTLIEGYGDPSGALDLAWTRRVSHDRPTAAAVQASSNVLFTVGGDLTAGVAAFAVEAPDGEIDRVEFDIPADLEISAVTGDAVLQWRSEGTRLTVLLRYLVSERIDIALHFQYAADLDQPIPLHMPMLAKGKDLGGSIGVRALAGLHVQVASVNAARELELRELPAELVALSDSPLLFGFQFAGPPAIALSASRLRQVELTSTLIDGIEASSVLLEEGTEITKVRLFIRNNTRQYLRVRLGDGAVLTHALLDGDPVRPATVTDDRGEELLFSLRQSERVDADVGRVHIIRSGDTLRELAHRYYSDPDKWNVILAANSDQLASDTDLIPGQQLKVPSAGPITIEESSFVLELAYRRQREALGRLGIASLALPEIDIDALTVTWHLYLPDSVAPLRFEGNLTQLSHIRYGAVQRLRQFFDFAVGGRDAWAGGGGDDSYESILTRRKGIYHEGVGEQRQNDVSPTAFPLVGERYRFKRILVNDEQPHLDVVYASQTTMTAARWGAMALAFALGCLVLRPRRRAWHWIAGATGMIALIVVAEFVLGVHRRLVWGIDLALAVTVIAPLAGRLRTSIVELASAPWKATRLLRFDNLALAVAVAAAVHVLSIFPLLLSLVAMVALTAVWLRQRGSERTEGRYVVTA